MKISNALEADKEMIAIQLVKDIAFSLVSRLQGLDPEELVEQFDQLQTAVKLMKEVNELHATWTEDFYKVFLSKFMKHGLFENDELTPDNIDPDFFVTLDDSTKYMSRYRYKTGEGSLDGIQDADLRIGNDILIMEDVNQFFGYLHNIERDDNVVYSHIILKIEERIDMSYFMVAITYNGHSFISTDAPSFSTPANKQLTRNARRHMEEKYDNLAFPYGLIDELDEIRAKETSVAVYGSYSLELHKSAIKELPAFCKLFIVGISDKLRMEAKDIETDVMLLSDYVNTKLIGEPFEITDADNDLFTGHEEKHKSQLDEIMETLETDETSLVKVGSDIVLASPYYDKNWLGTAEDLEKLTKWMALSTTRFNVQERLNEKFDDKAKEEAIVWLDKEINKEGNFERLWPFIFSGDEVHFEVIDKVDNKRDEDGNHKPFQISGHIESTLVSMFNDSNAWFPQVNLGFNKEGVEKRSNDLRYGLAKGARSYDDYLWRDNCDCCGKVRNNIVKHFRIHHWQQIAFLLDIPREELPAYYRVYKSDNLIPYYGNEIISDVHPMSIIKHPSWKSYGSGIPCTVHLCKRCVNKLNKKHNIAKDSLIKPDGSIIVKPEKEHSIHESIRR